MKPSLFINFIFIAALPYLAIAKDDSGITASELKAFKQRFEDAKPFIENRKKEITRNQKLRKNRTRTLNENKDARKKKLAQKVTQQLVLDSRLRYLRFILMLEENFRLLSSPEDAVNANASAEKVFSSQVQRKVASLRQDIRDAECARIRDELKTGRGMHSNEGVELAISVNEKSLDSIFDRNASKLKKNIARTQRKLMRAKASSRRNEDTIAELEKSLVEWNTKLGEIHQYAYGFLPGVGFEGKVNKDDDTEEGQFLKILAAERDKIIKIIRGEENREGKDYYLGEGEKKAGSVGGSYIYSSNLGVVLDISGSMQPHIKKLQREIAKTFQAPSYREVQGCSLSRVGLLDSRSLLGPDTMLMIEELCVVRGVDTVYWFCDLQDRETPSALRRIRTLLMRSGAAFHVKSMDSLPKPALKRLIDDFQD